MQAPYFPVLKNLKVSLSIFPFKAFKSRKAPLEVFSADYLLFLFAMFQIFSALNAPF